MKEPIKNCVIIGIAGKKLAGKSTVARYLRTRHGFTDKAAADPMYDALGTMFGQDFRSDYWQANKDTEPVPGAGGKTLRQLLQTLGTEWGREMVHEDLWVGLLDTRIRDYAKRWNPTGPARIVIQDVRLYHEVCWVKRHGVLVHVSNPRTEVYDPHSSEKGVDPELASFRLLNDGTHDHLYVQIELRAEKLGLRG